MRCTRFAALLATALLLGGQTPAHADYSVTDLVDSAKRGDGHAVRNLIEGGADLDARGPMGYTALHWAGIRGHWRIFAELVAAGAPVNAVGSDGGTPLHWTCHHDNPDAVQLLLDAGADVSIQNRWGRTPLHVAARRNCMLVAELLLEAGADPNPTTKEGWTPMHVAAMSGNSQMLDLLETRGADPTRKDAEGHTECQVSKRKPQPVPVNSLKLAEYEGIYDLGQGFAMKVWLEGDILRLREFAPDDLIPIGVDEFSCRQEPWRVRFLRGDDGSITTIEVDFLRRTVRGQKTNAPRYVGSKVCMDCHTGPEQGQQDIRWMRSRHAHAYWRLGSDWSLFLAKLRPYYQDLEDPISDDRCLLCHVTGSQDPDALFTSSYRTQEGIGCESCHGPGSEYATADVMADREAFLANGGRIPDAETCKNCHRNSDNFDWAEYWPKIAHPKPAPSTDSDE
ncbi:MAG: ankyrin repeat domain-containing protein [Thermoanaerobaculales bacterium]|nr:ankyrin repeat domain-containing protein [Thermoanaerobaculales bacterium]